MTDYRELIRQAIRARENSYAPYSGFYVGAALQAAGRRDGKPVIFTGCNVENAAFSPTNCAERTAFFKAVSEGVRTFTAIAIVGGGQGSPSSYAMPCGVCRQVMMEFCSPDTFEIIAAVSEEDYKVYRLKDLLPGAFGPDSLQPYGFIGKQWRKKREVKTRFYNARIMAMERDCSIIMGELWVDGDTILYVGDGRDREEFCEKKGLREPAWDQEIDCEGNVLMPGFKNAHTHSAMVAMRSFADDMPLQEWLNTKIFPLEAKMTDQDNYDLTQLAILEYLTTGVTAIFDMYLSPEYIAKACMDMGMRCVLVSGLNKFGPALSVMEERFQKLNGLHPLISYCMGVHAEYTCSRELLEQVSEMIHKYQTPFFAHMSETKLETEECVERYGMTPPALFDSLGLFDFGGGGYHCVYFTEEDMELFAKKGLHVITNPASNAKLASGVAPLTRFLEKGISVGIGTDGASSNNCLDMFREMFLATALAKLRDGNASAMPPAQVLRMACSNGARAMGLRDCDMLAEGKKADLIMIDLHQPNMQPLNNIPDNIVYSGSKQNVKLTMVGGRILYQDGRFLCCDDAEKVYAKANEIIARLSQA